MFFIPFFIYCNNLFLGEDVANDMMDCTKKENRNNKWMWKYTSFSSVIAYYNKQLNMKCQRIISFGDGTSERLAIKNYASTHHIKSLHIEFIRAPTFKQLIDQWIYIENNINKIILGDEINKKLCIAIVDENIGMNAIKNDKIYDFYVHDLSFIFKCDNKKSCTGISYQLPAIAQYFQLWMS